MEMTPRQRVQTALTHQPPDRQPIDLGGTILSSATPEMQERIAEVLGLTGERDPRFRYFDDRIQRHFDCELRQIRPHAGRKWGFREIHEAPMRELSVEDIERYPWPKPTDEMVEGIAEEAAFLHEQTDYFICAGQIGQGFFEAGCWLRGYDQILLDCALEPDWVHAFNRKLLEVNVALGEPYFGAIGRNADMVLIGDDLATQSDLYISPEMFRELYKPYFAEYIASIRRHCPDALIAHHCCGSSHKLFDDLIEIGVQVINPVQTKAEGMDPGHLAAFKPRLAFHGGGDLQHILPFAESAEVESFVKHLVETLGVGGGFVLAACHSLPDDVKPENVVTMLEAGRTYGPGASG